MSLVEGLLASPQQRRLWTLRLADGGVYTAEAVVGIDGAVDRPRLEAALRAVAGRYEILHTVFASLPGMGYPVQVLAGDLLPRLEEPAAGATVEDELRRLAAEVLDVSRGPLLRASLVAAGEESSRLVLVLPALCADGPTLSVLLRRIFEAYEGSAGEAGETLQYADLASWQNDLLESGEAAEERRLLHEPELWKRRGAALPFSRASAPAPFAPAALPFRWGPELADAVAALAGREGVEPAAVLLTSWLILLSRLARERDLVVGVSLDGRRFEDLADAVGPLARTLPLRALLARDEPWSGALHRVAESLRSLGQWQERFSLEQLAAAAGDPAPAPYFPVGFLCENAMPDLAAPGLGLRVERRRILDDRFDLALECRREGSEIAGEIRFDAGAIARADARPLADRLAALLAAVCRQPATRLAELPVLAEDERRAWLVERNATLRASTLGGTLTARFETQAALHPDRPAVADEDAVLTYGELEGRANCMANHLRRLGAGPETLVAICLDRSLELVAVLLGVLKAGGAYVPLDPTYPTERLALLLASSGARVLVTTSSLAARLSRAGAWDGATVLLDRDAEAVAAASAERPEGGPRPEDLAYVIYTSGSTGTPKGVMISHGAIYNRLLWMQEEFPLDAADRVLQKTPVSFDASVWELFCPLFAGARLELARPGGHQDAEYMVRAVAEREITVLQLVPSALRMVLEVPELERCISLRRLFCGGEALPTELRDRFFARLPAELVNLYGPTEVSIDATFHVCRRDGAADGGAVVPIGSALANTRLYLLDPEPVVPGAAGELYVGGAGLARGYLGRPDLTAERFVPDPLSGEPGARLYRTGDLARFRPDGVAEFLGRADHQVKIRGFRIEPGEIEAALASDPGVRAAVVAAREVAPGDMRLCAWIVPRPGAAGIPDLRERLRTVLPEHLIPSAFVVLDELPLLPNGKLDRAALPAPAADGDGAAPAAAAAELRTPVEDLLAGLWSDVLGRGDVGLHDDVFTLGAHSLLVTQLVSRLRQTFRVDLPMRVLFDEPTVAGQARRIEAAMRGEERALPSIAPVARDGGPLPVSSAQRRLWFLDQLDPGSSAYGTPLAFRLTGPLRVPLLAAALDRLVERHETLRTTFPAHDGQPVQRIGPPRRVPLPVIDVSALPEARRREEAERLLAPGAHPPFDLAAGPLLRVAALRLGAEEHLVLGALHHIVSDAWSTWVAVRELDELYGALAAERRPELPPLPLQYADFAAWQQGWLQGGELAAQLDYWRRQLAGAPPTLDLPTDFQRPPLASSAGDLRSRLLPPELLEGLRDLSRRERSSLYMTLLAAWYVLLLSLTGREDLVVGTSVAARERVELEGMIGFFINVLALRTSLAGDPPFAEVLRRVRDTALEGYLHQAVPFDRLLEELQAGRDRGRNPLFQVAFTFENVPGRRGRLGDLALEPLEMRFNTSVFDLALLMEETDQGLWSGMRYMTTLFRPATVDHWLAQLEALLARVVEDPSARVGQLLEFLAGEERRRKREQEATLAEASLRKLKTRTRAAALSQG
ncbi:MAG TPA: amino acid adenylation domain-containing protein [Thermoanaerobaculia bacterium]|jgi:amino acid adenylation domain-containing protein|nr:amino acid adenylation domain-containing protein [Thermoanaerobaculia bacterium]